MNELVNSLGPFDSEQLQDVRPYIDFGSIRIEPKADLQLSVKLKRERAALLR